MKKVYKFLKKLQKILLYKLFEVSKNIREINFRELKFWTNSRDKLSRKGKKIAKIAKGSLAKVSPINECSKAINAWT